MTDIRYTSRQVTIECDHAAPIVYNHYPRHAIWIGVVQIVGGVVMLVAGLVSLFSGTLIGVSYGSRGTEIALPAILTGAFGIAAGKSKAICQITTNMIFSIITAIGSCGVAMAMAQALIIAGQSEYQLFRVSEGRGAYVIMLIVSLIEFVVSIVQSAINCHFSCFCCKKCCCNFDTTTTEQIVISNTQQEQQLLLLGACAPGVEMQPTVPAANYGLGHQLQPQSPPQYSKYDV